MKGLKDTKAFFLQGPSLLVLMATITALRRLLVPAGRGGAFAAHVGEQIADVVFSMT